MKSLFIFLLAGTLCCCHQIHQPAETEYIKTETQQTIIFPQGSWQYFLQHLPEKQAPVLDYKGNLVANQQKHFAVINYDVGTQDLQQCADALMRLRAEYLFAQKRFDAIGFHFCSGQYYDWEMFCKGKLPVSNGNRVSFISTKKLHDHSHASLRKYLDIVYAYASTISLCAELKAADSLAVGTVIIWPGSPGHCCIIIDEKIMNGDEKLYKLAEGYMPAQSIYVLSNPYNSALNPWYHLDTHEIITASCDFKSFYLKKFE
jgi:hypothetical protein